MADPTQKRLLNDTEIRQLEEMAAAGANLENMAAILGISKRTLERRLKDQPGVAGGIRKGRAESTNAVENQLLMKALGKTERGDFNAIKLWLSRHDPRGESDDKDQTKEIVVKFDRDKKPDE